MAKKGFAVNQELTASKAKSKPKKWSFTILSYPIHISNSYTNTNTVTYQHTYSHLSTYIQSLIIIVSLIDSLFTSFSLSKSNFDNIRGAIFLADRALLFMIGPSDFSHVFLSRFRNQMPTTEVLNTVIRGQHFFGHRTDKYRMVQMLLSYRYLERQHYWMWHSWILVIKLAVPSMLEELLSIAFRE